MRCENERRARVLRRARHHVNKRASRRDSHPSGISHPRDGARAHDEHMPPLSLPTAPNARLRTGQHRGCTRALAGQYAMGGTTDADRRALRCAFGLAESQLVSANRIVQSGQRHVVPSAQQVVDSWRDQAPESASAQVSEGLRVPSCAQACAIAHTARAHTVTRTKDATARARADRTCGALVHGHGRRHVYACSDALQLGTVLAQSGRYKTTECINPRMKPSQTNGQPSSRASCCKYGAQCLFTHGEDDTRRDPLLYYYEPCAPRRRPAP